MIHIERFFTKQGQDVYDTCAWKKITCKITEGDKIIFELNNAEFPEHYSQTACDIVASKYFRRAGIPLNLHRVQEENVPVRFQRSEPDEKTPLRAEISLRSCIDRMVGHWTYWAACMKIVDDLDAFSDELKYMILHQYWSPNSPQWFNAGLNWAYGIKPKNEGYFTIHGEYISGCFEQMHACFIQPVEDAMFGEDSIFEALNNEARIFKKGSGTGTNFSKLRAKGERLTGGGKSSGVLSYLRIFDRSADSIKSGGTTRRSAKMVILDLDHPDVEEFITWKSLEETKVASMITGSKLNKRYLDAIVKDTKNDQLKALALRRGVESNYIDRAVLLGQMGYVEFPMAMINNDFNGEGYSTVSGQNSNNTVSIPDAFFKCLEQNLTWYLITRLPSKRQKDWGNPIDHPQGSVYSSGINKAIVKDGKFHDVVKGIQSKDLMDMIAFNAWQSADPGVHFSTTINDWHTCKADGDIRASNPCCFTGDTFVDTSEGKIKFEDLIQYQNLPYAFSFDFNTGLPVLKKIKKVWISGKTTLMCKVTTDKGVTLTCTPDHRFKSYSGEDIRACDLQVGQRLRKISRGKNTKRHNRAIVYTKENGSGEYQSRWMWEQINGSIPTGYEIHHKDSVPTNDKMTNFEMLRADIHDVVDSTGDRNPRWINVDLQLASQVIQEMRKRANMGLTYTRWNSTIRKLGFLNKLPLSRGDGLIQSKQWVDFISELINKLDSDNDKVEFVEVYTVQPTDVYDMEVEGVHNFSVSDNDDMGKHSIVVHNSEYLFLDNTACNLSSHRLTKHMGDTFNVLSYAHCIRLSQIVLDISVESALLPSKGIGEGTAKYRTTGNGYADIGAMLMKMGVPYDSDVGRAWIGAMTSLLTSECYKVSRDLADLKGSYEAWERNKEHHMNVMTNHLYAANLSEANVNIKPDQLNYDLIPIGLAKEVKASWEDAVKAPNGYRNAHVTVLAPTGTIGIQMDCDTTGIEPDFSLHKYKKLSGGGYIKMVNQSVPEALAKLGYNPDIAKEFEKSGKLNVNEEHKPVFACANEIHWKGHVLAMAAAQPFLSGAISKTINMHHDATVEDIKQALLLSHSHALKCNAIYRDGSKLSQPLNLKLDTSIVTELPSIKSELSELTTSGRGIRNKPPARRAGWTDEFTINGFKYYLRHNVDSNNKLCELWIDAPNESSSVRTALNTMCRFMSKALQYGMPIEEIVDTFTGIQQDPRGLVQHENIKVCKSIYDAVGRFIAYMYLGQKDMAEVQTNMLVEESTDVVSQKKTMKECPRCSSSDISAPSSCKNKCKTCGHEWGGCGE